MTQSSAASMTARQTASVTGNAERAGRIGFWLRLDHGGLRLGHEHIAVPGHRPDRPGPQRVVLDLAPQPGDLDVDAAVRGVLPCSGQLHQIAGGRGSRWRAGRTRPAAPAPWAVTGRQLPSGACSVLVARSSRQRPIGTSPAATTAPCRALARPPGAARCAGASAARADGTASPNSRRPRSPCR